MATGSDYRYKHFTTKLLFQDLRFHSSSLRPGDAFPEFDLPTADGGHFASRDVLERPLLVVTGSMTCPMTASAMPSLKRLHADFGKEIAFVMLDVREAHPGENYPQPETFERKLAHARALRDTYQLPWPVAVDGLDGTLHLPMDGKPNSAYLVDRNGKIVFRSIWARDERSLRRALESVARDEKPAKSESRAMLRPLVSAVGSVHEVMHRAGAQAERDHWRANPPMELAGRLASSFRPLSPDRRGIAAAAAIAVSMVTVTAVVLGLAL